MRFQGNVEVLQALWEKDRLLRLKSGRASRIRLALIVLGGTMRGILGAAKALELHDRGLVRCFNVGLGVSTGSPVVAYTWAGQAALAIRLYLEEGRSTQFIDARRAVIGGSPVDCDYAASIFRGATDKQLDQGAARAMPGELWAAVSHARSGAPHLIDLKAQPDIVHGIRASIAIPGSSDEIWVDGYPALDGSVACPFPAQLVCERFRPTHMLVFSNRGAALRESALAAFYDRCVAWRMTSDFARAMRTQEDRFAAELDWLESQQAVKWAVIWSDDSIHALSRDYHALCDAAARARQYFADLLLRAQI